MKTVIVAVLLLHAACAVAQDKQTDTCRECPMPAILGRNAVTAVLLRGGETETYSNVISVMRGVTQVNDRLEQSLILSQQLDDDQCRKIEVPLRGVDRLEMYNLGSDQSPRLLPVKPVREYLQARGRKPPASWFEIMGVGLYGGNNESVREVGYDKFAYGAEALINPFGGFTGSKMGFAFGGGIMSENSRDRYPLFGHLRFTLFGTREINDSYGYYPDACRFSFSGAAPAGKPAGANIEERPAYEETDPSAYLLQRKQLVSSWFRPFLFVEGGAVLNGPFEGSSGDDPVNPEDEGQYFFGGGAGMPLWDIITVQLAFRYMRLNLYTPCEACVNKSIVNTNIVKGFMLRVGGILEW